MRRRWAHVEPMMTQASPEDNAPGHVWTQVWRFQVDRKLVVHPEVALEIAAWYTEGENGFAQFSSTGTITEKLLDEIEELRTGGDHQDAHLMGALEAYLQACRGDDLDLVVRWMQSRVVSA